MEEKFSGLKQAADDIARLRPHAGWKRPNKSTLLRLSVSLTQKHMVPKGCV